MRMPDGRLRFLSEEGVVSNVSLCEVSCVVTPHLSEGYLAIAAGPTRERRIAACRVP